MKKRKLNTTDVYVKLQKDKSDFDPMGSYTGRPCDLFEIPVQDADDL